MRDLARHPLVTYNPDTIHHPLRLCAFAKSGALPARTISASTTEAILGMVTAGVGCSLVPSIDEASLRRRGIVVLIPAPREPPSQTWHRTPRRALAR